jgi:hypothetical protein
MTATPPDLARPDDTMQAVAAVSLRLMAGAVPKRTLEDLRRSVQASAAEYPWQVVTQAILAAPAEPQQLVQQGLVAQRDWILRGGRETPSPRLSTRAKGLFARLCAQLIFGLIYAVVIIVLLLLLKYKLPDWDIYRLLGWVQGLFGGR